jgi:translation elongation factor EF-Tu-like GTPase
VFRLTVADVFFIRSRGTVVTGKVEEGAVRVGDDVRVGDRGPVRVDGIEAFRKKLDQAQAGDNIGLLLSGLDRSDVKAGDVITGAGEAAPAAAPAAPAAPADARNDPRFAQAEAQRTQLNSMRDAGLMTDDQVDDALRALAFAVGGQRWRLTAAGEWRHD